MRAPVVSAATARMLAICLLVSAGAPCARGEELPAFGAMPANADPATVVDGTFGQSAAWDRAKFHDTPIFPPGFQIPILRHFIQPPHFRRGDPDDPGRHVGLGHPLEGTSWLNRPYQVGWLWGSLDADALISDRVQQTSGKFGGYRLGWDFDHYWGTETRLAFSNVDMVYATGAAGSTAEHLYWDANLLYYPWGDARWRPFFTTGMGLAYFRFQDENGRGINDTVWTFPWGGGVKYLFRRWLALRFSLMDNIAFGARNVNTQHNVSVTGGVEVHFGGPRTKY